MSWMPSAEGKTLNTRGSENGLILRDEVHTEGARITLELESDNAPFAITCGIYGWFFHTRFLGNSDTVQADYILMRADLSRILHSISLQADSDMVDQRERVYEAISAFVERYP